MADLAVGVKLPPAPKKANPLDKITPVTDALLQNPPTGEWLTWRRGFDYQGFSPLKQITKSNVNNLRVAWTWTLSPGSNEATPLVHDGVMFLHSPGDKLEALDAATGDLLWQYARVLPPGVNAGNKRAISIYGNKVYMGDFRRACGGARCEDRPGGLGSAAGGGKGLRTLRRSAGRQRQGDDRNQRARRRQELHRRARRRNRQRRLAIQHHRAARRARRRYLERSHSRGAQRRLRLDRGKLRLGAQPRVLRRCADL